MSEYDPFGPPSEAQLAAKAARDQTGATPAPVQIVEAPEPVAVTENTTDGE